MPEQLCEIAFTACEGDTVTVAPANVSSLFRTRTPNVQRRAARAKLRKSESSSNKIFFRGTISLVRTVTNCHNASLVFARIPGHNAVIQASSVVFWTRACARSLRHYCAIVPLRHCAIAPLCHCAIAPLCHCYCAIVLLLLCYIAAVIFAIVILCYCYSAIATH